MVHNICREVPCSLFPVPCSLFPVPCSLFPVPCSQFPDPCPLIPVTWSLIPDPWKILNPDFLKKNCQITIKLRTNPQKVAILLPLVYFVFSWSKSQLESFQLFPLAGGLRGWSKGSVVHSRQQLQQTPYRDLTACLKKRRDQVPVHTHSQRW